MERSIFSENYIEFGITIEQSDNLSYIKYVQVQVHALHIQHNSLSVCQSTVDKYYTYTYRIICIGIRRITAKASPHIFFLFEIKSSRYTFQNYCFYLLLMPQKKIRSFYVRQQQQDILLNTKKIKVLFSPGFLPHKRIFSFILI